MSLRRISVSPDERLVAAFVEAAVRRARRLATLEAGAWALGGAAAAAGAASTMKVGPAGVMIAGVVAATAVAAIWTARRWSTRTARAAVLRRLERAEPRLRNLLVTADELGVIHASPSIQARVLADTATLVGPMDAGSALSRSHVVRALAVAAAAWLLFGVVLVVARSDRPVAESAGNAAAAKAQQTVGSGEAFHVTATIHPPDYTHLEPRTVVDPSQLEAVEGSALTLTIAASAGGVTVEHDGASHALAPGADGRFADRIVLSKTGFLVVSTSAGGKRIVPLIVVPDALPVVRLTAPGRDLIYSGGNPRIAFDAHATDDFGLRDLALRYTKVSGSGEQFVFKEGQIPLAVKRGSVRDWQGTAARALADLDLQDGDMLVYRAVASDARPGDGSASSDSFFIEISKLGAAAGDAFTLPEQETRYALSQQMLIVKTERLIKQQAAMAAGEVTEAALNLAVEQRMIRAEFVFMLGGEIQDEEVEAEESTELQEGRQQNRGQRDVRAATQAMSLAGRYLTGADLTPALAAERAAVAALQRAFSKDRYILRALATRSQLDLSRRLTGDLSQASDWRRRIEDAPANRRAAQLQDLLQALGALGQNAPAPDVAGAPDRTPVAAAGGKEDGRAAILVLAEQALRIDPDSAALRLASADLQRVADTWSTAPPEGRARAIQLIAAHVAEEARKAMATAAVPLRSSAPALRGAFADAQHARRSPR
jgi:hypothetical protein